AGNHEGKLIDQRQDGAIVRLVNATQSGLDSAIDIIEIDIELLSMSMNDLAEARQQVRRFRSGPRVAHLIIEDKSVTHAHGRTCEGTEIDRVGLSLSHGLRLRSRPRKAA